MSHCASTGCVGPGLAGDIIDQSACEPKLRLMGLRRLSTLVIASYIAAAACGSGDDPSKAGAATKRAPGTDSSTRAASTIRWFPGAEPMLLLPAHSADRSLVAAADSLAEEPGEGLLDLPATLIRLDGGRVSARVSIAQGPEGCIEAALDPAPAAPWGVGFVGGSPSALATDSLRGMSRQDSTALTRVTFRLASAVPNVPGGRFAGLAFVLVDLWRVRLSDGNVVIVATTRRQINQEDSPLQERTFIVAESDSAAAGGYSLVYSLRSSGLEETVESRELLAAVAFPAPASVDLVVSHDFGDETSYSIVERESPRRWVLRWTSRRFSC